MNWQLNFLILLCVLILTSLCNASDFFYKRVTIGEHCSFSVPFLWKKENVALELPEQVKSKIEVYKSLQLIGKEVMVSASYAKYKRNASIDGGIAETVKQLSSLSNTTNFTYSCVPFKIKGGTAKVCRISYMSGKIYVYVKSLFIVPSSDLTASYIFSGVYGKKYNGKEFHWHEEVIDKLYRSIKVN